jgi:hypothetical protein
MDVYGDDFTRLQNAWTRPNGNYNNLFCSFHVVDQDMAEHMDSLMTIAEGGKPHFHAFNFIKQRDVIIQRAGEGAIPQHTDAAVEDMRLRIESMAWDPVQVQNILFESRLTFTYEQAWALSVSMAHAKRSNMRLERKLAFVMGLFPRLGGHSLVSRLDDNTTVMILSHAM